MKNKTKKTKKAKPRQVKRPAYKKHRPKKHVEARLPEFSGAGTEVAVPEAPVYIEAPAGFTTEQLQKALELAAESVQKTAEQTKEQAARKMAVRNITHIFDDQISKTTERKEHLATLIRANRKWSDQNPDQVFFYPRNIKNEYDTAQDEPEVVAGTGEELPPLKSQMRRVYDIALMMAEKQMISFDAVDDQVDALLKFDEEALNSLERVVNSANSVFGTIKTEAQPTPKISRWQRIKHWFKGN